MEQPDAATANQKPSDSTALRIRVAELSLGNGRIALIDEEDLPRVKEHGSWHAEQMRGQIYATHEHWLGKGRHQPQKERVLLHRFVMNAQPGQLVMHRNGNGLDCRKNNLRFGNHSENGASHRRKQGKTSKYRGVSRNISGGKPWQAQIMVAGVPKHLGKFDTEEEAARAYNQNALLYFGEHASINKI